MKIFALLLLAITIVTAEDFGLDSGILTYEFLQLNGDICKCVLTPSTLKGDDVGPQPEKPGNCSFRAKQSEGLEESNDEPILAANYAIDYGIDSSNERITEDDKVSIADRKFGIKPGNSKYYIYQKVPLYWGQNRKYLVPSRLLARKPIKKYIL